jgi:hypothetical protein
MDCFIEIASNCEIYVQVSFFFDNINWRTSEEHKVWHEHRSLQFLYKMSALNFTNFLSMPDKFQTVQPMHSNKKENCCSKTLSTPPPPQDGEM